MRATTRGYGETAQAACQKCRTVAIKKSPRNAGRFLQHNGDFQGRTAYERGSQLSAVHARLMAQAPVQEPVPSARLVPGLAQSPSAALQAASQQAASPHRVQQVLPPAQA